MSKQLSSVEKVRRAEEYISKLLKKRNKQEKKALIKSAPHGVIKHICNLCNYAINCDSTSYSGNQAKRLKPHIKSLKTLVSPRQSLKQKRSVLQRGGFLPILASILGPLIGGVVGAITSNK